MSTILQALATGAGILLPVFILVTLASITAANRGAGAAHAGQPAHEGAAGGESVAAPAAKLPFVPDRDPTVLEILVLGAVLFTLVMGGLLLMSVLSQM